MDEKKFKLVQPCGKLFTNHREYWLLRPEPVPGDSWERDYMTRWVVVPETPMDHTGEENLYSHARHIVITPPFTIEFASVGLKIKIWQLEDIDLEDLELSIPPDGEPIPAETGWLHTQLHLNV